MCQEVIGIVKGMAESEGLRRALQKAYRTKRQQHLDIVSRFVAFYLLGWEAYGSEYDLETFVNMGMDELRRLKGTARISQMVDDFNSALEVAWQIFGTDAFRKRLNREDPRKPFNKAYFEALSVALAKVSADEEKCLVQRKDLFQDNMMTLMNRSAFFQAISNGTEMCDRVRTRHQGIEEVVRATLKEERIA